MSSSFYILFGNHVTNRRYVTFIEIIGK